MTTRIIIVRHGNTFLPGEVPTRIGSETDMPLVEKEKSRKVGNYLKINGLSPDLIITAPLLRTRQTAEIINECQELVVDIMESDNFTEINYGPDENQTEVYVKYRIGLAKIKEEGVDISKYNKEKIISIGSVEIKRWDDHALPPTGWSVDLDGIKKSWQEVSEFILDKYKNKTVVIVSSNGIIRFSTAISSDAVKNNLKVPTGSITIFENNGSKWTNKLWGFCPKSI